MPTADANSMSLERQYALAMQCFEAHARIHKARRRAQDAARLQWYRAHPDYAAAFDQADPLVSVIIPTYDRARLVVERTYPSVAAQTHGNWELIIVGDQMDPEQAALLASIRDPRVRFVNLKRRGRYPDLPCPRWFVAGTKPVNAGLALARGRWIAHLDDDDEFSPHHLSALLELARKQRVEWVHGDVLFLCGEGRPSVTIGAGEPAQGRIARISSLYHGALKSFHYNGSCWKYFYPGDWDLWERFLQMGVTHAYLPRVSAIHHGPPERFEDAAPPQPGPRPEKGAPPYARWCDEAALRLIHGQVYAERMMTRWRERPTLHLVIHARESDQQALADTLDSLGQQLYRQMSVTVMADFPPPDAGAFEAAGIRWVHPPHPAALLPPGADGDWLVWLAAGARLAPQALFSLADYGNLRPQWQLIYSDDDRLGADGERTDPRFKPDFNLDFARSMPYFGPLVAVRAAAARQCDPQPFDGEGYDLALQILDRCGEQAIGHVADVLCHLPEALAVGRHTPLTTAALARHLARCGIEAPLEQGFAPDTLRVAYRHPQTPLVSIIIPTRDKLEFLAPCVDSLLAKTDYPHYELILCDNDSTDPDVLEYYQSLLTRRPQQVRVVPYPQPFNFSAMCNAAAHAARGDYLLFLNNDTQIVQAHWLSRMMLHGQRPDVGAVGCRLVYPETGHLQHAGVVLGLTDIAGHPFNDGTTALADGGYMNRAQVDQDYSAVTAACLLVRRSIYFEAGGMDEQNLAVLFNDVDLCLKIGDLGKRVVWTPHATVVHHGSTSLRERVDPVKAGLAAARARKEREWMLQRWLPRLAADPAYNRNLALTSPSLRVETGAVPEWDTAFRDRERILGLPLAGASGEYRLCAPFRALSDAGLAQCTAVAPPGLLQSRTLSPIELERLAPDTLVLHAAINDAQIEALEQMRRFNPRILRVLSLDDLITQLPPKNSFHRFAFKDARPRLRRTLELCQRLIVSTEPLRELARGMIDDIRVIPNRLERERWLALSPARRAGRKPRVGWAGAQQHLGDLELIFDVVRATAHEVEWVFMGMCPDPLRPYVHEFHDFVLSFDEYPARLAGLNLDLAIAPLEHNAFNEAKSHLRLLEYGALGWPVVCTDIYPYREAPVERVPNDPQAWIQAIRERVHDLDAAQREGDRLRQWVVSGFILEQHLEPWLSGLSRTPLGAAVRPAEAVGL